MYPRNNGGIFKLTPKAPYKLIIDFLREELKTKYSPGDKIPSENELAKMFGVSRLTARKAVEKLTDEGLLVRIPGIGTFVSEISKLAKNKVTYVGVAIGNVADVRGEAMVSKIVKTLRDFSVHAIFVDIGKCYTEDFEKKLSRLLDENVSGLIISPIKNLEESHTFKKFIEKKLPIVFIDRTISGFEEIPFVESNNYHGGYLLGEHLKNVHDSKKAIFVTEEGMDIFSVKERYNGFKNAFEKHVDVLFVEDIEDMRDKFIKTIKEGKYDSIFFCHDLLALSGITSLMMNGIRIPEDIRVVGFDDRIISRYTFPHITTVRQNFSEMGKVAALFMVKLLKGEKIPKAEHIPVKLVIRESCGCSIR